MTFKNVYICHFLKMPIEFLGHEKWKVFPSKVFRNKKSRLNCFDFTYNYMSWILEFNLFMTEVVIIDWFLYDNGLRHERVNRHLESNDLLFVNIRCIIKLTTLSCRYIFISTTEVLQVNDDVIRSAVKPVETLNKNTNILGLKSNLWETL